MSGIVRIHKQRGDFSVVPSAPLNDASLTWEARGMHAYLVSKPDGWQISMVDLIKQSPAGRDKTRRILRELTGAGYVKRTRRQQEDGTFAWDSVVYEQPDLETAAPNPLPSQGPTDEPSTGFPSMVHPSMENPSIQEYGIKPYLPFTQSPLPPANGADADLAEYARFFVANLLQAVQERNPRPVGPVALATSTMQHLRRFMSGADNTPLLTSRAIEWALDRWEDAKPNERCDPNGEGAVNWLLAVIAKSYANQGQSSTNRRAFGTNRRPADTKPPAPTTNQPSWSNRPDLELIGDNYGDELNQQRLFAE